MNFTSLEEWENHANTIWAEYLEMIYAASPTLKPSKQMKCWWNDELTLEKKFMRFSRSQLKKNEITLNEYNKRENEFFKKIRYAKKNH